MTTRSNSTQDTDRISREEMIELFGSEMPIEAVNLLWGSDGSKTCGELRAELRRIANARPSQDTEDVVILSSRCGYHFEEDCQSCRAAKDSNDYRLQSLSDRIDVLEGALKPFAEFADPRQSVPASLRITVGSPMARTQLTMGDCYHARAALHQEGIAP